MSDLIAAGWGYLKSKMANGQTLRPGTCHYFDNSIAICGLAVFNPWSQKFTKYDADNKKCGACSNVIKAWPSKYGAAK